MSNEERSDVTGGRGLDGPSHESAWLVRSGSSSSLRGDARVRAFAQVSGVTERARAGPPSAPGTCNRTEARKRAATNEGLRLRMARELAGGDQPHICVCVNSAGGVRGLALPRARRERRKLLSLCSASARGHPVGGTGAGVPIRAAQCTRAGMTAGTLDRPPSARRCGTTD